MKTLTRMLMIAVLSAPVAGLAEDTPKTGDAPKTGDTSKPGDTAKTGDTPSKDTAKASKLTKRELQVMAAYRMDNQMEVELGNLVQESGARDEVKTYAQMLVTDHGDFDKRLTALAQRTRQSIPKLKPMSATEKQEHAAMKKTAADIKKLKGEDLDRAYLRFMVEDHGKVLSKIDAHIADAKNPQLAEMLREVKPTLQRHHDQARELQKGDAQAMR